MTKKPDVTAALCRALKKRDGRVVFCAGGHEFETVDTQIWEERGLVQLPREEQELREVERLDREGVVRGPLEFAHSALRSFIWWSDTSEPAFAQKVLMDLLRREKSEALNIIADMIDPAGKSYWRLKLTRRGGRAREMSTREQQLVAHAYRWVLKGLKDAKRASPAKTARGMLARVFKMTDEEIRAVIERAQGKRRRGHR